MCPQEYGGPAVVGKHTDAGVSLDARPHTPDPAATWATSTRYLTQRPDMRVGDCRNGKVRYPARVQRPLSSQLPPRPTAVHVYDAQGFTTVLPLDLDAHEHTPAQIEQVRVDLAIATDLLCHAGLPYLVDRAHDGAHIYVLLAQPISADEALTLALALRRRLPSLDVGPLRSTTDGLITIPGSPHKLGGHRELVATPDEALRTLEGPWGAPKALDGLRSLLAPELRAQAAQDAQQGSQQRETRRRNGERDVLSPTTHELIDIDRFANRSMSDRTAAIAAEGDWRAAGYPSPSEARRSVLLAAVATGHTEISIRERMLDGTWSGLRSLFAHKGLDRLHYEYARAHAEITDREHRNALTSTDTAHQTDTSGPSHSGGRGDSPSVHDVHGTVRHWRAQLHAHGATDYPGAPGWPRLMVLRALATMCHMTKSTLTASGVRWLAIATGYSPDTVARTLYELAHEDDAWIELTMRGRGIHANAYTIRVPTRHEGTAVQWPRGVAHSVRPAFTRLGVPAALVYEAIEQGYGRSRARLRVRTGLSAEALRQGIDTLASWHLISVVDDEHELTSTDADLDRLATRLGATAHRAARVAKYRKERERYLAVLAAAARRRGPRRAAYLEDPDAHEIQAVLDDMRPALWDVGAQAIA